jgi:hypothetical protein
LSLLDPNYVADPTGVARGDLAAAENIVIALPVDVRAAEAGLGEQLADLGN